MAASCRQERCACVVSRAIASISSAAGAASQLQSDALGGMVDKGRLDDATTLAAAAAGALKSMENACARSCKRRCRGCRVGRLINQTQAFQDGIADATEMGHFTDGEAIVTKLPKMLEKQAQLGLAIASDLLSLGRHCPKTMGQADSKSTPGGSDGRSIEAGAGRAAGSDRGGGDVLLG
jgi:hypothetical protein